MVTTITDKTGKRILYSMDSEGKHMTVVDFAHEILKKADLKYGQFIDVTDYIKEYGFINNCENDPCGARLMMYYDFTKAVANQCKKILNIWGFHADKMQKEVLGVINQPIHEYGNIVYTNYPSNVVKSASRAISVGITSLQNNHDEELFYDFWEEYDSKEVERWKKLASNKLKLASITEKWNSENIAPDMTKMLAKLEIDKNKMHEFFKDKQPPLYGIHIDEIERDKDEV